MDKLEGSLFCKIVLVMREASDPFQAKAYCSIYLYIIILYTIAAELLVATAIVEDVKFFFWLIND